MVLSFIAKHDERLVTGIIGKDFEIFMDVFWVADSDALMQIVQAVGDRVIGIKPALRGFLFSSYDLAPVVVPNHIHSAEEPVQHEVHMHIVRIIVAPKHDALLLLVEIEDCIHELLVVAREARVRDDPGDIVIGEDFRKLVF